MPQERTFQPPAPKSAYPDPQRPRRWVECFSPQTRARTKFIWLNNWIAGVHTHFLWDADPRKRRTMPCLRELGECPWCPVVRNRKWKGYGGGLVKGTTRPVVMELTENAWETCTNLRSENGALRGWEYQTFRERDDNRSKQFCQKVLTLHSDPGWAAVDLRCVLARIWAVEWQVVAQLFPFLDGAGGWGHPDYTHPTHEPRKEETGKIGPAKPIDPKTPAPYHWRKTVEAKRQEQEAQAHKTAQTE